MQLQKFPEFCYLLCILEIWYTNTATRGSCMDKVLLELNRSLWSSYSFSAIHQAFKIQVDCFE